jgi:hypothetical protein
MRDATEWLRAASKPDRPWSVAVAFLDLPAVERQEVMRRLKAGEQHPAPAVRALARRCIEDVVVAEMDTLPISDHMAAELTAAGRRGAPLAPGERVPRCTCSDCRPDSTRHHRPPRREPYPALDIDAARAVPILTVARRLGITMVGKGWATCPFHADSTPSLHVNASKNVAFCNPCGRSWDSIALMMELGSMTFRAAVHELTGLWAA